MFHVPNVRTARQRTVPLMLALMTNQIYLVEKIERLTLETFHMTEAHLFWVRGYSPCLGLRPVVTVLLRRHHELKLPEKWVTEYLWLQAPVRDIEAQGVRILAGPGCSEVSARARHICRELRVDAYELIAA